LRGVGIGFVRRVVSSAPPGRNGMWANRDHGFRFAPPVATRLGPSGAKVLRSQGAVQQTSKAPVNGYAPGEPTDRFEEVRLRLMRERYA